jgi:hypothetical protein
MVKEGKIISQPEEIQTEIRSKSQEFEEQKLPIFKQLGLLS